MALRDNLDTWYCTLGLTHAPLHIMLANVSSTVPPPGSALRGGLLRPRECVGGSRTSAGFNGEDPRGPGPHRARPRPPRHSPGLRVRQVRTPVRKGGL